MNDSLEQIKRDANKIVREYWRCGYECDKCPSMIDGKTPGEWWQEIKGENNIINCGQAMNFDLLERQEKILAANTIELPLDEDGNPWHVGDETTAGKITRLSWNGKFWEAIIEHLTPMIADDCRRSIKAYDRDGERIFEGETIWRYADGSSVDVNSVTMDKYGNIWVVDCDNNKCLPHLLTHRQPIFDMDNEIIEDGSVLWEVDDQHRYYNKKYTAVLKGNGKYVFRDEHGGEFVLDSSKLTHYGPVEKARTILCGVLRERNLEEKIVHEMLKILNILESEEVAKIDD